LTLAEAESLNDFRLFALGTLAHFAPLIVTGLTFPLRCSLVLEKSEIRSPDLTSYSTLLPALRQDQNEKRNSRGISINMRRYFLATSDGAASKSLRPQQKI